MTHVTTARAFNRAHEEGRGFETILTLAETCREDFCKAKHSAVRSGLGKESIHIFIVHFRNKTKFHFYPTLTTVAMVEMLLALEL